MMCLFFVNDRNTSTRKQQPDTHPYVLRRFLQKAAFRTNVYLRKNPILLYEKRGYRGLVLSSCKHDVFANKKQQTYEPRLEKINILHMRKKDADQLRGNREADQRLWFRYIDSTIPLLSKSEISSL